MAFASHLASEILLWYPKTYSPCQSDLATTLSRLPEIADVWNYARQKNVWPRSRIDTPEFLPAPALEGLDIPHLATCADLADWLLISQDQLTRFADLKSLSASTDNAFAPHYRYHTISKASGQARLIEEPKPFLKTLQKRILKGILNHVPTSEISFGFTRGRDCLQAASKHCGEDVVVTFDLRSFFPSVRQSRVIGLFRCLGYPDAVARHLAGLTTVITPAFVLKRLRLENDRFLPNRHLPQGASTSPAIANLSAYALDRRLMGLARRLDAQVTRYADDITFSGPREITTPLKHAVPEIIADSGFVVNPQKTHIMPRTQCQVTTGLVVNDHINILRRDYDNLRAELHHLLTLDDPRRRDASYLFALDGRITWVERVHPVRGQKLRESFNQVLLRGN
ncbi:reverse transcriptase family protein [Shimia sediminis]|uniref:reverse transcriptase family protein n=1 Tax=Shimia sediminis TaxID=2497945 RepID=UPI0013E09E81|nr:reverse transcriptase family protein [Shimia sediminis]